MNILNTINGIDFLLLMGLLSFVFLVFGMYGKMKVLEYEIEEIKTDSKKILQGEKIK
tara:strand:+ start:376 stop:546 length:171 start_codon:yes stop_codon:yes gene_type:complete